MSPQGWCPIREASCGLGRRPSMRATGWRRGEEAVCSYAIGDLESECRRSLLGQVVLACCQLPSAKDDFLPSGFTNGMR